MKRLPGAEAAPGDIGTVPGSPPFEPLNSALSDYAKAFENNEEALRMISGGQSAIAEATAELESEATEEPDHGEYYHRRSDVPPAFGSRSIFDDVDD
jgi:hypothetical protein